MGSRIRPPSSKRLLRAPETTVRLAVPQIAHTRTLPRSLESGGSGKAVRADDRGVPSSVWVGWLGGEDQVDLRTSNRLTNPRTFGKLSGSWGLRVAAPMERGQVPGNAGESIRTPRLSALDPGSKPR